DVVADDALDREEEAWARWAPDGVTPPAGFAHWRRDSPGFRAILRLTIALRALDDNHDPTPRDVEALSIADFLVLDTCYQLVHYADQPQAEALVVTCENCGAEYLGLR